MNPKDTKHRHTVVEALRKDIEDDLQALEGDMVGAVKRLDALIQETHDTARAAMNVHVCAELAAALAPVRAVLSRPFLGRLKWLIRGW